MSDARACGYVGACPLPTTVKVQQTTGVSGVEQKERGVALRQEFLMATGRKTAGEKPIYRAKQRTGSRYDLKF
jgi:hypothetical protein